MDIYICDNVFVPLRAGPSHKTEMMSQILFGEKYTIIDKSGNWMKIENIFNKYQGWIDMDHMQYTVDEYNTTGFVLNRTLLCYKNNKTKFVLEPGCEVFNPNFEEKKFNVGINIYTTSDDFTGSYLSTNDSLSDTAMKFINCPYIWGGRIPSGIDCSGLTQLVYKIHGISLPHDSRLQAAEGKIIDFIDDTQPGDLVFFDNDRNRISHVGMIISKGLVIHASGRVRIDTIDHQGIFKPEIGRYSHKLRTIRRIL